MGIYYRIKRYHVKYDYPDQLNDYRVMYMSEEGLHKKLSFKFFFL